LILLLVPKALVRKHFRRLGADQDTFAKELKDVCKADVEDDGVILILGHHCADGVHALRNLLGGERVTALLDESKPWLVCYVVALFPVADDAKSSSGNAKNVVHASKLSGRVHGGRNYLN